MDVAQIIEHSGAWETLEKGRSITLDRKVSGHTEAGASVGEWTGPVCVGGVVGGTCRVILQVLPAAETTAREPGVCDIQCGQFFMPG